jgi:hypothetical protein
MQEKLFIPVSPISPYTRWAWTLLYAGQLALGSVYLKASWCHVIDLVHDKKGKRLCTASRMSFWSSGNWYVDRHMRNSWWQIIIEILFDFGFGSRNIYLKGFACASNALVWLEVIIETYYLFMPNERIVRTCDTRTWYCWFDLFLIWSIPQFLQKKNSIWRLL